jgi:4-amino-4-deoxy-L-arabinose transferase-like glycosyltransferase
MTPHHATRNTQYACVLGLLLSAFFFRTYELAGLGLGLEHDEVAEWQIANGIRHGENALFFKEAYGQEPLFLYLMAGSTALIGDNVIGVRFTSVFVAMLTLAAAYRMLRRMFSPLVALVALAGMSIALWPVFWGRVGLRAMTLPLMMCLGFDWLWRGLTTEVRIQKSESRIRFSFLRSFSQSLRPFLVAGIFIGLSAYTYLSSRAIPILLLAFVIYLALFARDRMRGRWRNLGIFFVVAIVVALPLAVTVLANPDLQFRVAEVSGPLDKALKGDTSEVVANIPRALGMFTVKGDNTVRDNWPDRPVFPEPIGQLLFGFGFLIALTRLHQPRYALALIWIGAMLTTTIVTAGAPNFTRTLGALPMAFALPGIAIEWLTIWPRMWLASLNRTIVLQSARVLFVLALLIVFAMNAVSTYEDYFNKWPAHSETQFVFQADFAAIAKDIDTSTVMDVSVGGLSNDTLDDPSLYLLRQCKNVRVRWFNSADRPTSSGGALVQPLGSPARIYIPAIVPIGPNLDQFNAFFTSTLTGHFRRFEIAAPFDPAADPARARLFDDSAILLGWNPDRALFAEAGNNLEIETRWLAREPITYPRRIFVHLVDLTSGKIVAQHDGLDAPAKFWRAGDWIAQRHILPIPADTPAGKYELQIGLYNPDTGQRVLQTAYTHTGPPSDYYVLGTVQITH